MTAIIHHPSDLALANYAAGTLDQARRLVVATHISICQDCRYVVRGYAHMGGVMLELLPPVQMSDDALAKALGELDRPQEAKLPVAQDDLLPLPLAACDMGKWRWIGSGVYWRSVSLPVVDDTRVFMLRAKGGTKLPRHRHEGIEWTCVLEGAFAHAHGRFGPGDFDEADDTMEHDPVVEAGAPCICVVALQGNIQLQSRLGRLLQPLIRF